jgi:uncharacterized membrane protein YdfJ with MMPL/SSD domain
MKKTAIIIALLVLLLTVAGCAAMPQASGSATQTAAPVASESAAQASASPSAQESAVQSEPAVVSAEGIYQGQADNNFIEIRIAGEPDETAYKVFMLTGEIKDNFEALGLDTGDNVSLSYYENENGQLVLTELAKKAAG